PYQTREDRMQPRRLARLCFAASLLFPAAAANAACLQSDLGGTWQAYTLSIKGGNTYWARCKLVINGSTGAIANTNCFTAFGYTALTQGKATLANAANCTFTAQYKIAGVLNTLVHGTLSKDKEVGQGVGTLPSFGQFTLNMTKL
ncbi:MAG TPA: hypothetical protein VFK79_15220, partial [Xanthobacteraceae bacterium]|nr:hypothetical protein [Xanthobacteraceae bacterium]